MRRIPTTSLRSTLLALLLTLCLALPALAAQKEGLLLVAFGTSVPEAKPALTAIDKEFKAAFPHSPVIWAYTSSIIRAKLEKKGVHIGDVAAGLEELARQKVDVVRVQSLHVVAGEEFSEMERLLVSWLVRHPDSFKAVYLGRPLLESRQDAEDVVAGLPCRAQQELERADLEQGGHAVGKQEDADQCHRQDGHTGAESEHALHNAFF